MENLFEAQKGTVLEMVNEIWLKGEFICPTNSPVAEGEEVLRELTPYEKAIYMAKAQAADSHNELVRGSHNLSDLINAKDAYEILDKIFWASVCKQLIADHIEHNNIGVRQNWQLVTFDEPYPDMLMEVVRKLVEGL
jgi:hypothetical protein